MNAPRNRSHPLRGPVAATALALGLGWLAACSDQSAPPAASTEATTDQSATVRVGDPWVRATAGSDVPSTSAAYMTIDNDGSQSVTLTGASSPVAGRTEIQETTVADGATSRRALSEGLEIAVGRGKLLEPGGYQVLLLDLRSALVVGDEVELTLEFADGSTRVLAAPVREFTEEQGHHHEPGAEQHDDSDHHDSDSDHGDSDHGDSDESHS